MSCLLHISILERGTTPGAHRLRRNEVWGGTTLTHAKFVASVTTYDTFSTIERGPGSPPGKGRVGKTGSGVTRSVHNRLQPFVWTQRDGRVGGTALSKLQCAARAVAM